MASIRNLNGPNFGAGGSDPSTCITGLTWGCITRFRESETISGSFGADRAVGVSRNRSAARDGQTRKGLCSGEIYARPAAGRQWASLRFETGCGTRPLEAAGIEPACRRISCRLAASWCVASVTVHGLARDRVRRPTPHSTSFPPTVRRGQSGGCSATPQSCAAARVSEATSSVPAGVLPIVKTKKRSG